MVRSCLAYAVRRDLLPYNPAREAAMPKGRRRTVKPIRPETVERMRAGLGLRDATLLSVMYGAGLRPGEALALREESIREPTLLVEFSISFGAEKDTKTRQARAVRLLGPVAQELAGYRLATAKERLGSRYLFPRQDGRPCAVVGASGEAADEVLAVELERTAKGRARLRRILAAYVGARQIAEEPCLPSPTGWGAAGGSTGASARKTKSACGPSCSRSRSRPSPSRSSGRR
jgi:integrase